MRTKGGKGNANAASGQEPAAAASAVQEFAGKASLRSNSPYTPSQRAADTLWTADTGATSHMTPHKHWLRDYKPFSIPIRLANNHIVHSAGVGTLLFAPELKGGKLGRQVLLSRVLHVPELSSNLLSVLYLVRNHQFQVHISAEHMEFERDGTVYMIAPIDTTNTAYLAGEVVPVVESAQVSAASTLPLNPSLWHRRFTHFHHVGIQSIIIGKSCHRHETRCKDPSRSYL